MVPAPTVIRLLEAQARDSSLGTNAVMTQLVTLLFQEAGAACAGGEWALTQRMGESSVG